MSIAKGYTYVFAYNDTHAPITKFAQLRSHKWDCFLGLFFNGKAVGKGSLRILSLRSLRVHTEHMELLRGQRHKGHGIQLYKAMIDAARALGAQRICSSRHLNSLSTRMWKVKLPREGFKVSTTRQLCARPCRHCRERNVRFYIDL